MTELRERPILFSAPMIKALLAGRKSQTRRVLTPQPAFLQHHEWRGKVIYEGENQAWCWRGRTFENLWDEHIRDADRRALAALAPLGKVGDRLWVRETWGLHANGDETDWFCSSVREVPGDSLRAQYRLALRADWGPLQEDCFWRPAIFMPRWASRFTLEVTEVRVQRLHEISDDDAMAEGVTPYTPPHGHIAPDQRVPGPGFDGCRLGDQPHRLPFADLWDKINGKARPILNDDGDPVLDDNDNPMMHAPKSWASNPWVFAITFIRIDEDSP